jgi:hypothetical protein
LLDAAAQPTGAARQATFQALQELLADYAKCAASVAGVAETMGTVGLLLAAVLG